jgi:hypothetical protein
MLLKMKNKIGATGTTQISSSSSGAEPPSVGGFGLPNDILPFCSMLITGYPIFNLHLMKVLYDIVLPSIRGSSFWSVA